MKKQILYLLLSFLIIACGGGDDDGGGMTDDTPIGMDDDVVSDVETFDVSIESTVINSFQIIELGIPDDIQLTQNTYQASFGSQEITMTVNENNSLSFMAPDIQSGDYIFSVDIAGKKGKLDFKLSQIEDIENVEEFLNQELFNPLNESRDEANSALGNPDVSDEERTLVEQGNEFYNAAIQVFENLTSDEKQQFSKLLVANEISFLIDETTGKSSSKTIFDWDALDADARKLVIAKIKMVAIIGTVTAVLLTPEPVITKVIAVLVGAYGVYKLWDVLTIRERIINRIFIPIENLLESISGKSNSHASKSQDLIFVNDTASNFGVTSTGRKIIKSDENHPDSRIANAVTEINETDNKRNELKIKIDQLLGTVGSFFGLGDNQIQEANGLPESIAEEIITVALENFFIDDHPEDIEVSIVALDANRLQIKFTSETNEPTQFTANFIYDDGDFRTETALNVNLDKKEENNEVDLNGYWYFLELGNGVVGTTVSGIGTANEITRENEYVGFIPGINFLENGTASVGSAWTVEYSQSESSISISMIYDISNLYQKLTFAGTWNEETQRYVGSASFDSQEWVTINREFLITTVNGTGGMELSRTR